MMQTNTYTFVTLEDFVDAHDLDLYEVADIIDNSHYTYGTNDDTLVEYHALCNLCGTRPLAGYSVGLMVSLGS